MHAIQGQDDLFRLVFPQFVGPASGPLVLGTGTQGRTGPVQERAGRSAGVHMLGIM